MGKATTTIKQVLNHRVEHAAWLCAHQALFNQVAAFYFAVIQAHEKVLELSSKDALTALEKLTHTTERNPHPVMPLSEIQEDIPALFRRAAIHAALGSAHSFYAHLKRWRTRKEKAEAKGKKFTYRPPVPPRTWNKSATLYAGMWKDRTESHIVIKVWTGRCWSWLKVRLTGRELPAGGERGSPSLVRHGGRWWLHTPIEKQFATPPKIVQQVTTNPETKICAVDLNLGEQIAVCTIQTVEGSILATRFIGGGREIAGFRKRLLGFIARNRNRTGLCASGEQDNAGLWQKISNRDEHFAHLVSRRIVEFAQAQGASICSRRNKSHTTRKTAIFSSSSFSRKKKWRCIARNAMPWRYASLLARTSMRPGKVLARQSRRPKTPGYYIAMTSSSTRQPLAG
jgi:putative transposase